MKLVFMYQWNRLKYELQLYRSALRSKAVGGTMGLFRQLRNSNAKYTTPPGYGPVKL